MEREILRLAEELDTDAGAVRLLESARIALPPARLHALAEALTQKDGYGRAVQALERELPPAEDGGFGILAVMLRAALRTREMYAARHPRRDLSRHDALLPALSARAPRKLR